MSLPWSGEHSLIAYVDQGFGFLKAGGLDGERRLVTESLVVPGNTLPGLADEQLTMVHRGTTYGLSLTIAVNKKCPSFFAEPSPLDLSNPDFFA